MEKKVMVAVDGSIHATNAVKYAARMSAMVPHLSYTLFYVQPTLSQYLLEEAETDLGAKAELKKIIQKNAGLAQQLLEKHKAKMVRLGLGEDRIEISTQKKMMGICKDILDCAQQGLFDAVIIGRRGLSRIQETLMGSTTAKLVEHSRVIPLWVVDGDVTSTKLMLAVDGSEASFRAVDHLCFMLGGNQDIKFTLFHVRKKFGDYCPIDVDEKAGSVARVFDRSERRCMDRFHALALDKFKEAGIKEDQIKMEFAKSTMDVGKALMKQIKKEDYGTIVVGRSGVNKAFFMGSVSRHVLNKTSGRAVWLVP
jgi:nucleotide-binding universal stress UspA family protein